MLEALILARSPNIKSDETFHKLVTLNIKLCKLPECDKLSKV